MCEAARIGAVYYIRIEWTHRVHKLTDTSTLLMNTFFNLVWFNMNNTGSCVCTIALNTGIFHHHFDQKSCHRNARARTQTHTNTHTRQNVLFDFWLCLFTPWLLRLLWFAIRCSSYAIDTIAFYNADQIVSHLHFIKSIRISLHLNLFFISLPHIRYIRLHTLLLLLLFAASRWWHKSRIFKSDIHWLQIEPFWFVVNGIKKIVSSEIDQRENGVAFQSIQIQKCCSNCPKTWSLCTRYCVSFNPNFISTNGLIEVD